MSGHATGQPTGREKTLKALIGHNINQAIKASGMTSAEVARRLNTHEKSVRRWRTGEVTPARRYITQLAVLLANGEVGWFYTKHDKTNGKEAAA